MSTKIREAKILMKMRFLVILFFLAFAFVPNLLSQQAKTDSLFLQLENVEGEEKIQLLHEHTLKHVYTDYTTALEYAKASIKLSQQLNKDSLLAYSYYYTGVAYYYKADWQLSTDYFVKAMESKWGKSSDRIQANCAGFVGICYKRLGEYEKSVSYYYQSIRAGERLQDSLRIARTQLNMGSLYMKMNEYDRAVEILKSCLKIFKHYNEEDDIINACHNLFISEFTLNNHQAAESYFKEALQLANLRNDTIKMASIHSDYGNTLLEAENFTKARQHFKIALQYADTMAKPVSYYLIVKSLGVCNMYLGNLNTAEEQMLYALNKLETLDAAFALTYLQLNLSRLYARKGDFLLSKKYADAAIENERKIYSDKRLKSISEMQVKYETEKVEQELAIQNLKLVVQKRKILFTVILASLFAIALVFVLLLMRKIKNSNRQLFDRNQELSERWEKLKINNRLGSDESENNELYISISKLMNEDKLYTNPELTLEYMSRKVHSNTKYVSKTIKEQTSLNFNSYINTYRIEEAKKYLLDPVKKNWSLNVIAESCGFNNPTTFYQSFKKNTGLTPAAYRNNIKK